MRRQIRRYDLTVPATVLGLEVGASLLHFAYQQRPEGDTFSLWAEVPHPAYGERPVDCQQRYFRIVPTGAEVPPHAEHLATCVLPDNFHTFHLYEVRP